MCVCIVSTGPFEDTFENTQWGKDKQMQPVWLCILSGRQFEETFEKTQWKKVKQMQHVWLCILWGRPIEGTFENSQWRKVKQMQTMRFREKEGRPNFLGNTLWYCGVDFYIELFDHQKFGRVFILPGHFSHWYDMILYFFFVV